MKRLSIQRQSTWCLSGLDRDITGLPNRICLWITMLGRDVPEPRIWVSDTRGRFVTTNAFSVTISEHPRIGDGEPEGFTTVELDAVFQWVQANRDVLLEYWSSDVMSFGEVLRRLVPLDRKLAR